jgi:hypothetical protein
MLAEAGMRTAAGSSTNRGGLVAASRAITRSWLPSSLATLMQHAGGLRALQRPAVADRDADCRQVVVHLVEGLGRNGDELFVRLPGAEATANLTGARSETAVS